MKSDEDVRKAFRELGQAIKENSLELYLTGMVIFTIGYSIYRLIKFLIKLLVIVFYFFI